MMLFRCSGVPCSGVPVFLVLLVALKSSVKLCKSTTKIFAYGSTKPLPLKGEFQATVESNKRYTVSVIHVVEGGSGNLLSAKTAQDLALIN